MRVRETVDELVDELGCDDPDEAGGLITVAHGTEVTRSAFGLVNLEHRLAWRSPEDADRPFRMGSIAKHFTAVAMVVLESDGALSLDDDVRRHLPDLAEHGHVIRLRQLLDQTSGLRDEEVAWRMSGATQLDVFTVEQRLELHARMCGLNARPGTESLYVSAGTLLCSAVVERVSGLDLDAFLRRRVFEPLGMLSTYLSASFHDVIGEAPGEYVRTGPRRYRFHRHGGHQAGDGALVSTSSDLLRWNDNLRRDAIGVPDLVARLCARPTLPDGRRPDYALGTIVRDVGGAQVLFHAGSNGTQKSIFLREPSNDLCVVVQTNRSDLDHHRIGHTLVERLLGVPRPSAPPPMPTSLLGTYGHRRSGLVFHLEPNDPAHAHQGSAQLRFTSATSVLIPEGDGTWVSTPRQNYSARVRATGDAVTVELGDRVMTLERAGGAAAAPSAAALVGCYRSAELRHVVQIETDEDGDGGLRLRLGPVSAQQRLRMRPVITDVFDCEIDGATDTYDTGWQLCSLLVRRADDGAVASIVLSHAVCRDVEFVRVG